MERIPHRMRNSYTPEVSNKTLACSCPPWICNEAVKRGRSEDNTFLDLILTL